MTADNNLAAAIAKFGVPAKAKLSNPAASGAPEDQLRAPLETLIADLAELTGLPPGAAVPVGESSLADLKTRPDYAVTLNHTLVGFIEVKAPGKGADPRRFRDPHDWTPTGGAAITFTGLMPDLHYYHGRGGRAFPLWTNRSAAAPNVKPALLNALEAAYGIPVTAPDVLAYIAAVAAHPAYTARFQPDLVQPGL